MKQIRYLIFALVCVLAQGAWATNVATENSLRNAITDGADIKLTADITLSSYLEISSGQTVTLDLNGHKLDRGTPDTDWYNMVIYLNGGTLTINDGSGTNSGQITGGRSHNGGGILCENGSTLTVNGGTFTNNQAAYYSETYNHGRGGAIFVNEGCTLTVNGGTFEKNKAYNGGAICIEGTATISGGTIDSNTADYCGGAIYNTGSVTFSKGTVNGCSAPYGGAVYNTGTFNMSDGTISDCESTKGGGGGLTNIGTVNMTGGTFIGNTAKTNAGGLWNGNSGDAHGTLNISGGTFTENTAKENGGGIWTESTLIVSGGVNICGNTGGNLYLKGSDTVIECSDAFNDSTSIGVTLQYNNRKFTAGFGDSNPGLEPSVFFTADNSKATLSSQNGEAYIALTNVSNESDLNRAIQDGATVTLAADIDLSSYVDISGGKTVTLDLNGHTLDRNLSERVDCGNVIRVESGSTLYVKDSSGNNSGKITGGYDSHGGGICAKGTLYFQGGTISDCHGSTQGGAIYNESGATLYFESGVIDNCAGQDCGGIYNAEGGTVYFSGGTISNCTSNQGGGGLNNHGTMTISGGTITGNHASSRGGGVWNGESATLTISGGTITNNRADTNGGGVFSYSDITMSGGVNISGNEATNLYLNSSSGKININGSFSSDASIGISLNDSYYNRTFTSGFKTYNRSASASTFFSADVENAELTMSDNELYLGTNSGCFYIERSWTGDNTDGHVVKKLKIATGVSNYSGSSSVSSGWYLLSGNHTGDSGQYSDRVTISGDVHFILQDGCNIEFDKGIYIKAGSKLYVHPQSGESGYMYTDGSDGANGSIGGNEDVKGGRLIVHGGKIYAKPSSNNAAGIGGGDGSNSGMQSVTIYGGTVEAEGKSSGAGIGCGQHNEHKPEVTIYGGTVTAQGGSYGAGIGGSEDCNGGTVKIYGGSVTAKGGQDGAGIGGGEGSSNGTVYIYGGTVNATGGNEAAGIGGGEYYNGGGGGGTVYIYGGTVKATAGKHGSGIGGGKNGAGADVYIYGGTVTAKNTDGGWAIGGGKDCSDNGSVTLGSTICVKTGGSDGSLVGSDSRVSTLMHDGERTAMDCSHSDPSYSDKSEYYHQINCSYCDGEEELHEIGSDNNCTKCGHALPTRTFTFYESNTAGTDYAQAGTVYHVQDNSYFTFPSCTNVPSKTKFVGWELSDEAPESMTTDNTDGLVAAESTVYVGVDEGDRTYFARYIKIVFNEGTGSESDPFILKTTDDLKEVSRLLSEGYDFNGFYLQMANDIEFDSSNKNNYTAAGSEITKFNGSFDGQGYAIIGININKSDNYQGLFGYIGENGVVKNVTVDGTTITGGAYTGTIAGRSQGTIENCHAGGSVTIKAYTSNTYYGGIVGYTKGTVAGCISRANIGTTSTKASRAGGIAGYGGGTIKNNMYLGPNVYGKKYIGSILGQNYTETLSRNCYVQRDTLPNAIGGSSKSQDKTGAVKAYKVSSGTADMELYYGSATTSYDYEGISSYSCGLLYGDTLYTGATTSLIFMPIVSKEKIATNLQTTSGTLTENDDYSYTLAMNSADAVITGEASDVSVLTLLDNEDNTNLLRINNEETVNVDYDRELTTGENGESTAYTVCLPYDFDYTEDADEYEEDEDDEDEDIVEARALRSRHVTVSDTEGTLVKVFTLAAVDKENKQFIFVDAPTRIPAGEPVVVVIYKGAITLNAHKVRIECSTFENGLPVYPSVNDFMAQGDNFVGFWRGSLKNLRAFYEDLLAGNFDGYKPMYQPIVDGEPSGELQEFPADQFADDFRTAPATGIRSIVNGQLIMDNSWYDLLGRKLDKKPNEKGVYIHNNKKKVIK